MSLKVPYFSSGCFKNLNVYCGVNNELQSYTGAYYPASCSNYIKPFLSKWKTLFISLINTYDSQYTTRKPHDRMSAMKFSIKKNNNKKTKHFLPARSTFQNLGLRNYSLIFLLALFILLHKERGIVCYYIRLLY